MKIEEHWIDTGNGRIYARSWTPHNLVDESPIILFHDSLGCVQLWRNTPEDLAEVTRKKVIAYDRLGFGQSDKRNEPASLDFIAEEATLYVPMIKEQLGIDQFIAFGHSVGGAIAVVYAAEFPQDCVAVITESSQAFVEDKTITGILKAQKSFQDPIQFAKLEKLHGDKALWVLKAWTDIWLSPEFSSWNLKDALMKVQCPILAIHGEKDEYGSLEFPNSIAGYAGGTSEKLIITDCGHVPHREQPDIVLKATEQFIQKLK